MKYNMPQVMQPLSIMLASASRMFFSTLIVSAYVFSIGCATGTNSKSPKNNLAQTMPALANDNYASVSAYERVSIDQCGGTEASWKKETLKNLIKNANACYILQKNEKLQSLANHIAQKFHNTPWGPYYLSLVAQNAADYPRALWMIELAIKKSPKTALLYYQKARILWSTTDFSKAVENYNLALKENPRFVEVHLFLAQLYYKEQNFKLAEKHFLAITEINSEMGQAFAGLAESRLALNNDKSATELYEKAVNLSPRNLVYRARLAGLYESIQKDNESALSMYKKIREMTADNSASRNFMSFDLNEKIKKLEEVVARQISSEKKVTKIEDKKARVKK